MRATAGFLAMAAVAACFIDRKSNDFECDTTTECDGDLVCEDGYCVEGDGTDDSDDSDDTTTDADTPADDALPECPPECSDCDASSHVCIIACSNADRCGDIECPDDWNCQILCQGKDACGDILCDDGPCTVQCAGDNACGVVNCRMACACDVDCDDGTSCTDAQCPVVDGMNCTEDGSTDSGCTSTRADCNQCN